MIEVKQIDAEGGTSAARLVVDDDVVDSIMTSIGRSSVSSLYIVHTFDNNLGEAIVSHSFLEISQNIENLTLMNIDSLGLPPEINSDIEVKRNAVGELKLSIVLRLDANNWKHLWSPNEYAKEFEHIIVSHKQIDGRFKQDAYTLFNPSFAIEYSVDDFGLPIKAEAAKHIAAIRELHELTETSLLSTLHSDSIAMHFDFPEEVRVPCEQYLLYFAQFLKDLGVEANTALTHEAGQVLFTITPEDKDQALDKISEALEVYLNLPKSPISDTTNESIAIQRLESNILRLRSDLKLAAAELQAKNATIEAQRLTIDIHKRLLSGEIIIDSLKDVIPKSQDKGESLISTKSKESEVDLPEIFGKLKHLFTKEDE